MLSKRWALAAAFLAVLAFKPLQFLRADDAAPATTPGQAPAGSSNSGSNSAPGAPADSQDNGVSQTGAAAPSDSDQASMGSEDGGEEASELGPKMERLKDRLGLSDDQVKQVQDLRKKNQEAMKPLHEKMKGLVETLKGQVDSKASDSDINNTLDALQANEKAMDDQKVQMQSDLRSVLKPSQAAQYALMMLRSRMGGAMMRGRGHGSGDGSGAPAHGDSGGSGY